MRVLGAALPFAVRIHPLNAHNNSHNENFGAYTAHLASAREQEQPELARDTHGLPPVRFDAPTTIELGDRPRYPRDTLSPEEGAATCPDRLPYSHGFDHDAREVTMALEWSTVLDAIARGVRWGRRGWRRWRYGARVDFDLDWKGPPITVLDGSPIEYERGLAVTITASKDDEFQMADGAVEVRPDAVGDWIAAASLDRRLRLPITVDANRTWDHVMYGESLADDIMEAIDPGGAEPIQLRIRIEDHHGVTLVSDPLTTSIDELHRTRDGR